VILVLVETLGGVAPRGSLFSIDEHCLNLHLNWTDRKLHMKNILMVLFSTSIFFVMEGPWVEATAGFEHEDDDASTDAEPHLNNNLHEPEEMQPAVLEEIFVSEDQEEAADSVAVEPEDVGENSETEKDDSAENVGTDDDNGNEKCVDLVAKERKSRKNPLCLFTTGLGFSAGDNSVLKSVVKSAASRNEAGTFVML
jgi:hypothetical protein